MHHQRQTVIIRIYIHYKKYDYWQRFFSLQVARQNYHISCSDACLLTSMDVMILYMISYLVSTLKEIFRCILRKFYIFSIFIFFLDFLFFYKCFSIKFSVILYRENHFLIVWLIISLYSILQWFYFANIWFI
jgi:hypothetical protein